MNSLWVIILWQVGQLGSLLRMLSLHLVGERQAWDPNLGVFFLLCCTVVPAGSSLFPHPFSVYPFIIRFIIFKLFLFWSPGFPTISTDQWTFIIFFWNGHWRKILVFSVFFLFFFFFFNKLQSYRSKFLIHR